MSIRRVVKTVAATGAATLCGAALVLTLGSGVAGASSLTNGTTTLSTIGTVTTGSPYSSGQQIDVTVTANSTMSASNLAAAGVPGCTGSGSTATCSGNWYVEECTDPVGGSLPTTNAGCEAGTDNYSQGKSSDGSLTLTGVNAYTVYDLPDSGTLGPPTMTGTCDVSPNTCVLGIFATNPQSANGFAYPHIFSAAFQMKQSPDGLDDGASPGDGTPEVPLAIGLPLAAMAIFAGLTIRHRRRNQQTA
jgi:hypothetical protein